MIIEVKIPSPGESITEVELTRWFVTDGEWVPKDKELAEIESDKATLTLVASASGKLHIKLQPGTTQPNMLACTIDTSVEAPAESTPANNTPEVKAEPVKKVQETPKADSHAASVQQSEITISPVARNMMEEHHLTADEVLDGLRRIGKKEVEQVLEWKKHTTQTAITRAERSEKMSQLRKKLSQRLVAVKNETAMLTTFNEADMSEIMHMRSVWQKEFTEKHGIKLGFMSFFTKAVSVALLEFPKVNAQINGEEIIYHDYCDVCIAVQTDKGLMVPVLRNTESMSLSDIEKGIAELAQKARSGKLSIDEMTGGTFTITNGGIFGSLMSTPIINPPQSAILGMHNVVDRPVAINGNVEIRPMMYLALSYDHRLVDGKDSVRFLVRVKELLEQPHKLLFGGTLPEKALLGL